ncbi:chromatin assembly factor 1 subunit FAS1 [Andrographis paniculata]|uniref:chromatin assembly factor 1 subunit FAS1 n=1 Tax=Andrographis paniculata TaxID=175694 RepID=UPI0021E7F680|nr:chromatin assembly factor 1 subunit FAS1 [Andrographis paniculata]
MAEVEHRKIDVAADEKPASVGGSYQKKRTNKRKSMEACQYAPTAEEKEAKIKAFREEINSLVRFCNEKVMANNGDLVEIEKVGSSASLNVVIACLMEERSLPLSNLVDEIFDGLKSKSGNGDCVSKAIVKSSVLKIGQRLCYGMTSADADILEDEAEHALWCWETRDLKLIPKLARPALKVRRTCRKKIQERIMAVWAMIRALEKLDSYQELMKASEKLSKVLNEVDIRLLMENMSCKNGAEMAEKDAQRGGIMLIKQLEKSKKEMEKERKKMDRELQKEKLQNEKEQKRLHDEAEKERKRREKDENEMMKKLKKQQEEAERCQKRKDREETELRNQLALQKQASLMDRFLKRSKTSPPSQNESSMLNDTSSGSSTSNVEQFSKSVTLSMDSVLAQVVGIEVEDIWRSHLNAWRCIGPSHLSRKAHWSIRQKPKIELIKELKLTTTKELTSDEDLSIEKLVVGWADSNNDGRFSQMNSDSSPSGQKRRRSKQLLQFDKSHRPAFYGIWPKKSQAVGPRHPFAKDLDIDYEIDSDEEWEEEEPGESLSDCDKDEEDENVEELVKNEDEEEDEDEDGFFVPDGYLSENEGLSNDEMECDDLDEEVRGQPSTEQTVQSEEFCTLLRQQKYLNSLTEHALKKNKPLIILNLMHDKTSLLPVTELSGAEKLERMCLQALSMCPLPGFSDAEISISIDVKEDQEASSYKLGTAPPETPAAILDSNLPTLVSTIQIGPNSIGNIVKSLHTQFPAVPKSHLRKKVHEISEFLDNRWQVKKEILDKLGLSTSPEKRYGKVKSIATYLKKRCLPPSRKTPQLSREPAASQQQE